MQSTRHSSILLPWEVIERIISHSCDLDKPTRRNSKLIRNFSLTCRKLRPRSLCFLVADAALSTRKKVFDFCDFLQGKPHLKPLVRSIIVHPDDFAPVPLLRILPNLSKIDLTKNYRSGALRSPALLNQSILTCCQLLSARIQTLCLFNLVFATRLQFVRVLSAFPSIVHLVCSGVVFSSSRRNNEGNGTSMGVARQRLCQRLQLRILHIRYTQRQTIISWNIGNGNEIEIVDELLSGLESVQSTVESLTVEGPYIPRLTQHLKWPHVRSLTFKLQSSSSKQITNSVTFLEGFHYLALKEVTVEVLQTNRTALSVAENLAHHADLYGRLERALLRFPHAQLVWTLYARPIGTRSWIQEFRKRFPALFLRGALTVLASRNVILTGHTGTVSIIVISPDSKLVASGSRDGTIVLWDTTDGTMLRQWVAYDSASGPMLLAFSPNGQRLISKAWSEERVGIWDIDGGLLHVFQGHNHGIVSCTWDPQGDVIGCGFKDATVRLWDANTFQPLHIFKHASCSEIVLVEFSSDGHWLLTGCDPCSYYIWDAKSGVGRQLRVSIRQPPDILVAAAFDPGNMRCVIVSPTGLVEILTIEGVEENHSVVLGARQDLGRETRGVAFSPNGNLVLTVPNKRVHTHAIRIWDAHTGANLLSLQGHEMEVWMACFSPCGKYVASVSRDYTVRLWRTSNGSCIATLSEHKSQVSALAFSPDGINLVWGMDDGPVIIRRMCDILPIDE